MTERQCSSMEASTWGAEAMGGGGLGRVAVGGRRGEPQYTWQKNVQKYMHFEQKIARYI